jgi:hypothetical protein
MPQVLPHVLTVVQLAAASTVQVTVHFTAGQALLMALLAGVRWSPQERPPEEPVSGARRLPRGSGGRGRAAFRLAVDHARLHPGYALLGVVSAVGAVVLIGVGRPARR